MDTACRGEASLVDDGLAVAGGLATDDAAAGSFVDDCLTSAPSASLASSSMSIPSDFSRLMILKALCRTISSIRCS